MSDELQMGMSERGRVRVVSAQVTMLAKALASRHLAGPVAGRVLAEGLAGVALMSADLSRPEETVYIRLKASGPVGGVLVEAAGNGDCRGFPTIKIIGALDATPPGDSVAALGGTGSVQIVQSLPGRILNQSVYTVAPPRFDQLLARYYLHSLQVPTAVAIRVSADAGGISQARAVMAQRMPDTESAVFESVLLAFFEGRVAAGLDETAALTGVAATLGLPDLASRESRELRFRCRCSQARTEQALGALSRAELEDMLAENRNHQVTCHMCGQDYQIGPASLRRMLETGPADTERSGS